MSPPADPIPAPAPAEIGFLPLAGLAPSRAEPLVARASRHLAPACRLLGEPPVLDLAFIPDRDQLDADHLLGQLEALAAAEGAPSFSPGRVLVGLAGRDLAIPIFTFVFGRARLGGRAAIISLARLLPEFYGDPPDPALTERRATAEILHELGHLAGLAHCPNAHCLMHFSTSIEVVDLRGLAFCPACATATAPGWWPAAGG